MASVPALSAPATPSGVIMAWILARVTWDRPPTELISTDFLGLDAHTTSLTL